ncbi:hypothetical protein GALL_300420 [mine drainage metagenome]|uniref:Uncharacterized protein n=1 Tax=mine drainage metagenome TaxID=410659 RepID=A0A1J5R7P2_9ZZZZ
MVALSLDTCCRFISWLAIRSASCCNVLDELSDAVVELLLDTVLAAAMVPVDDADADGGGGGPMAETPLLVVSLPVALLAPLAAFCRALLRSCRKLAIRLLPLRVLAVVELADTELSDSMPPSPSPSPW